MLKHLLFAVLILSTPASAAVRLPKIIGSRMVLQQNATVKLWGWAEPDETVQVTGDWFDGTAAESAGADGHWQVSLQTGPAGGPHTITVKGENTIHLENILFGEVWIASGQSNMEMPLVAVSRAYTGIKDAAAEVASARFPQIRLFQAGNFSSREPRKDVQAGIIMYGIPPAKCTWSACSPDTVATFASTAYFFARELHQQLNVPIGIIDAAWGGTPAEAWTPAAGLRELGYVDELQQAASLPQQPDRKLSTRLYNGMIHPLRQLRVRGVIWYQGEGNARRARKYRELFSTMIRQWRAQFGYEFPFYFVQIAPYDYGELNAAFLREAQLQTMTVAQTGMAVTMDIGNLTDIHPKNKQEVGRRLALWALAKDYGRDVVYSGPIYKDCRFEDGTVRIRFRHLGGGLTTGDGKPPTHLQIAGGDRVFHPATALIEDDELVVSSAQVAQPRAVRYGFTSQAEPNLMNREGLPASPFRTDAW